MKPIYQKIDLNSNNLPHWKHVRYLHRLETFGGLAYRTVMRRMHSEIKKEINHTGGRLAKSDTKLGSGWSGKTPKIEIDLSGRVNRVISKYTEGLRWIMLGNEAGEEAVSIAKEVGLYERMPNGILTSAYMNSVEAQADYFEQVFGVAPKISTILQEQSIQDVIDRSNRYLDEIVAKFKNDIINSIGIAQSTVNMANTLALGEAAFETVKDEGLRAALINASKGGLKDLSATRLDNAIRKPIRDFSKKWDTAVVGEVGMASGAAAQQTMLDVYAGYDEGGVKVVNITMKDDRVCEFCHGISYDHDGNYHVYKLSDIKPLGSNYGKKRGEWSICVPPHHVHCRCELLYVPQGFKVSRDGILSPE